MKELFFNSILIADISKKTAKLQVFSKGFNVITSSDNHVGKSSLIKSLYYALGAEIEFDSTWDKNSKIYIVNFEVDKKNYKIARFLKKFVLFENEEIILFTDSVTKDLAKKLEEIFDFGVYLPNRNDNKIELAPPVFMFMPYYIDQDRGWTEIYDSFSHLEQYTKDARIKSLYYHLGIYNRATIELMARKDSLSLQLKQLEEEGSRLQVVISVLSDELKNIVPAVNVEELERNLILPKEKIAMLVEQIGKKRNEIQKLETTLQNHQYQLNTINMLHQHVIHTPIDSPVQNILACPKCGYVMDKEIFEIVEKNYTSLSRQYAKQQILLLIQRIDEKLGKLKIDYIELMNKLKEAEAVYDETKSAYDIYLAQKGLSSTFNNMSKNYEKKLFEQAKVKDAIHDISSELNKLPNKKEVEKKYIEFTKENLVSLGAWEEAYEGKIKLLKPLKGQGTLNNKIILSQVIALFETMDSMQIKSNRFPFIIDSPRGNEASYISSKEILKLIFRINSISQIILVTMDFANYKDSISYEGEINIVTLEQKYTLLIETVYKDHLEEIESLHDLFSNFKKMDL